MAGSNASFDAQLFRDQIRATMTMGLPEDTAERATFRWNVEKEFAKEDASGHPFDWTSTPTTTVTHADVQVPVAVEFARTSDVAGTAIGNFDMSRVVLTLLDVDHVQVATADEVLLGGNIYDVDFVEPPIGLFTVTVYRWHIRARDEA
jgi:hypothetical protein